MGEVHRRADGVAVIEGGQSVDHLDRGALDDVGDGLDGICSGMIRPSP